MVRSASAPVIADIRDPMAHAHNADVERAVIAVVLDGRYQDAWHTIRERCAGPAAFWHQPHRLIAMVIDQLVGSGKRVDAVTVSAAAAQVPWSEAALALRAMESHDPGRLVPREGCEYDDSLLAKLGGNNAVSEMAEFFGSHTGLAVNAETLATLHRQRLVIGHLAELLRRAQAVDGGKRASSIAEDAINYLSASVGNGQGAESIASGADQAAAAHDVAARAGDQVAGSWGVKALDTACRLAPGRLVVVAARPGCGKTSMLLQSALATRDRLGPGRVALISLEMSPADLAKIILGRQVGVGKHAIERGWLSAEKRIEIDQAIATWRDNDIPVKAQGGKGNVDEVCAWIRALHRRSGDKLLFVGIDYLGLINGSNPRQNTNERVGEITRRLKLLTIDLGVCVMLLCQMNRDQTKENRRPRLSDLRDSGNIEQDADAVVFLHGTGDEKAPVMVVNAMVAKNRGGEEGSYGLEFLRAYGQGFRPIGGGEGHGNRAMYDQPQPSEDVLGNQQQEP